MTDICAYRAAIGVFNTMEVRAPKSVKLSSILCSSSKAKAKSLNVVFVLWLLSFISASLTRESSELPVHSTHIGNSVRLWQTDAVQDPQLCSLNLTWFLSAQKRNKLIKAYSGNRNNKTNVFSICHWNAGSAHFQNKLEDVEACLLTNNLDIMGVSEANCNMDTPLYETRIEGYSMVWPKMVINSANNMARLLLIIKDGISFKVCEDLMSPDAANVWIELSTNGGRKILVGQIYRV